MSTFNQESKTFIERTYANFQAPNCKQDRKELKNKQKSTWDTIFTWIEIFQSRVDRHLTITS